MIRDIMKSNENKNVNDNQIAVLKEHFPGCFDMDGRFDLEKLSELLKDKVDFTREGYGLSFLGKSYAKLLASLSTTTVIRPVAEHNGKPENAHSGNVFISGDNLDALHHLKNSYEGRVKCIYIDPPYNTGGDGFVYSDNFNFTAAELEQKLSIDHNQAQRIMDLTKRKSSSHSAWLTFMYPRLLLALDLLSKDGVMFISVDDNEQANLKLLCDDVFGEENFVTSIAWQSRTSIQNDTDISTNHEYVLIYAKRRRQEHRRLKAKNIDFWYELDNYACLPIPLDIKKFSNADNDPRGLWKADPFDAPNDRGTLTYAITNPNTGDVFYPPEGRCWSTEEDKYLDLLKDGRILFGANGDARPQRKVFYEEKKMFGSVENTWFTGEDSGTATGATKEQQALFEGRSYFDTPKPTALIKRLINLAIREDEEAIVLDFFSGSATTAHAVMELNAAGEKPGRRKFILVQWPEDVNRKMETATADMRKKLMRTVDFLDSVNRPHTLDQIGIERIIRAARKINRADVDLGFKCYDLAEPGAATLDKMVQFDPDILISDNTIYEEFGRDAILATWTVADGYGFNAQVEQLPLSTFMAYTCGKHIYLVDPGFTDSAVEALMGKYETDESFNPDNIVLFGYNFTNWAHVETLKNNIRQLNGGEKNLHVHVVTRY